MDGGSEVDMKMINQKQVVILLLGAALIFVTVGGVAFPASDDSSALQVKSEDIDGGNPQAAGNPAQNPASATSQVAAQKGSSSAAQGNPVKEGIGNFLARYSPLVVKGRVLNIESRWNPEHDNIFSFVELAVEKQISGARIAHKRVTFRVTGGTVGQVTRLVVDGAHFEKDSRAIVFLLPRGGNGYALAGQKRGKFSVETDPKTKREVIVNDLLDSPGFRARFPARSTAGKVFSSDFEKWVEAKAQS